MHSFTASPDGISSLPIAINVSLNSNIMTHNSTTYSPSTPILSSILTSRSFQTHPTILLTPISNSYNTSLYSPFSSNSFPQTGPSVFPGPSSIFPYLIFLGGPSTDGTLDLAPMPRAYNHFPTSLPLDPFHHDFFSVLKAASFIYSIHFPHGEEAKPLLVTGIHRSVSLFSLYFIFSLFFFFFSI